MGKHVSGRPPRIAHEIRTSLPGQHIHTAASEPESGNGTGSAIYTGQDDVSALASPGHRVLGIFFWLTWLAWGFYTWWFVERTITDFVVASVVWTVAFIFSVVGIPIVRQTARNQRRR